MTRPVKRYAFIHAKLRTRLSKMLSADLLTQMIRSHSLQEAVQLLRGGAFDIIEQVYDQTGDLKMAELELLKQEIRLYTEVESYLGAELLPFIRALTARYEIDNLKNLLRLWFDRTIRKRSIQEAAGYLLREKIHFDLNIDAVLEAPDIGAVIAALSSTPYAQVIGEHAAGVTETLFPIEIALDHFYYRQLLEETERLEPRDRGIARRLIGVEIDLQNIGWLVRFKDFYKLPLDTALPLMIPYGHNLDRETLGEAYSGQSITGIVAGLIKKRYAALAPLLSGAGGETSRLVLIERVLSEILMLEVRHILTGYPFAIGIVLAYFILKKNEISRLMTILNAKYYMLDEERIKGLI
jgi:V/A-type H+-transporting ATPase subunit C